MELCTIPFSAELLPLHTHFSYFKPVVIFFSLSVLWLCSVVLWIRLIAEGLGHRTSLEAPGVLSTQRAAKAAQVTDCTSPKLGLIELWMRTKPEGKKNRIPCCTYSLHKKKCILLFPFCTEVNEEGGVDSDCNIGISKLRVIARFPVLLASSMGAARQFWELLKDERKTVLVCQLCDDLIVHLFNYVYFLIKQILMKNRLS